MKKFIVLVIVLLVGCTLGPRREDYQVLMNEDVESPFFYVPPLNQKDYQSRTWILLAESQSKMWFYDPYTLTEDEDGVLTYDTFFKPREQNALAPFNSTLVGPYRQKIDCFGNNQWSEIFYIDQLPTPAPSLANIKPINGSGWVKIAPRTAMAYMRGRLCGRKFLDEQGVNFFLYQDGFLPMPKAKPQVLEQIELKTEKPIAPVEKIDPKADPEKVAPPKTPLVYEVINNEVVVIDAKKDVRQLRMGSYLLGGNFPKKADYVFTANCQSNTYNLMPQGSGDKSSGTIGQKDSLSAVAFNRACGDHGAYMKTSTKFSK
jgi:hypothetical protein